MAFYYDPSAGGAYDSVQNIANNLPGGSLIYSTHQIIGNGMIILALLQIFVLFFSRRFRISWFAAWVSDFLLLGLAIALSWTSMILKWEQLGYWRLKIELQTIEQLPFVGHFARDVLTGGSIDTTTVEHFYTIHSYILSAIAVGIAVLHLGSLLWQEWEQRRTARMMYETAHIPEATPAIPRAAQTGKSGI
nr:cytochrome b N-terminal domain-containing protein [Leptolyngbya ohadii]